MEKDRELKINLKPIGVIYSSYEGEEDLSCGKDKNLEAQIEVYKEYQEGLSDLEGFSHLLILYFMHKSQGYSLRVRPYLDDVLRGLFATRHPNRPNPIGLCICQLLEIKGNMLKVRGMDALNGSPLLDIKPYTPRDQIEKIKIGWLTDKIKN